MKCSGGLIYRIKQPCVSRAANPAIKWSAHCLHTYVKLVGEPGIAKDTYNKLTLDIPMCRQKNSSCFSQEFKVFTHIVTYHAIKKFVN
jgi:hypothetical protein